MNRIERMMVWLIGIAAALLLFTGTERIGVHAEGEHVHCYCGDGTCTDGGHSHAAATEWNAWTADNSLPTSGNWYLTEDVSISAATKLTENTELNLCLNGHTVTSTGCFMFNLADGGSSMTNNGRLRVTDCAATAGSLVVKGSGRAFRIDSSAHAEVYRITIDATDATITYGTIAFLSDAENNRFKAFGAVLKGGKATIGGGALYAGVGTGTNYSQIELYRSTLSGGNVESSNASLSLEGGNIALKGFARLILENSTVSGGSLSYTGNNTKILCKGGNVSGLVDSRITISGTSKISGGTVAGSNWCAGGNLNAQGYLTVTGSLTVENGNGKSDGGNFYMTGSQLKSLTGAKFTGGTAATGGSISCDNGAKVTFNNCTISGGTSTGVGGNVYIKGTSACTVTFTDTTVTEGLVNPASTSAAKVYGGNIGINGSAAHTVTINGASSITKGRVRNGSGDDAASFGGNIGIAIGKITIEGSTKVENGWIKASNGYNVCAYGGNVVIRGNAVIPSGKASFDGATTKGNSVSTNATASVITIEGNAKVGMVQVVSGNATTRSKAVIKGGYVGEAAVYNGDLVVEGGTVNNVNATGNTSSGVHTTEIKGGYVKALTRANKNGTYYGICKISGGAFETLPDAAAYTLVDGYQLVDHTEKVDYTDSTGDSGSFTTTKKAVKVWTVETLSALDDGSSVSVPLSGGGTYPAGDSITLSVGQIPDGLEFLCWKAGETELSSSAEYTFTFEGGSDHTYIAVFRQTNAGREVTILVKASAYSYQIGTSSEVTGTAAGFTATVGDDVTLTFTDSSKEFDGWLNASGKLIGREAVMTFTVSGNASYEAKEAASGEPVAVFFNAYYQIVSSSLVADLKRIPDVPTAVGRTNGRWMLEGGPVTSVDVLKAAPEKPVLEILPKYDAATETYRVEVLGKVKASSGLPADWTALDGTSFTTEAKGINETVSVTAKEGSETFLYFANASGEVLSTAKTTVFRFTEDTTVYAVYGTAGAAGTDLPTVKLIAAKVDGASVYFEALRNVPEGFTMIEQGLVFATEAMIGTALPEEAVKPDSTQCVKYVSSGKLPNDVTGLLLKNVPGKIYAAGYVIYKDNAGEVHTVVSAVASGEAKAELIPVQNVFDGLTVSTAKKYFYFFYQLTEEEQKAYNEIVTGILSSEGTITLTATVGTERMEAVMAAVNADQPALFWSTGAYQYSYSGSRVYSVMPEYLTYTDLAAEKAALESVKNAVVNAVSSMTDDQKIRYIHDYVIGHVSYAFRTGYDQTAHQALVNGSSVCAGYARSAQYLAMAAGIPCFYCEGEAYNGSGTEAHGWDIVLLNGHYYNLDVTWDEVNSTDPASTAPVFDYYLLTDAEIEVNHTRMNHGVELPACTTEYPFAQVFGREKGVEAIAKATGVTLVVNSLEECRALRKDQLVAQGPGTVVYEFIVSEELYQELSAYNADQSTYQQDFVEAATALGLNGFSYGFSWSFPMRTGGEILVHAEDLLE